MAEISRLVEIVKKENLDFIVGTGGGKAIDTYRMVAEQLKLPLITIPTSAATCSAASAVAVVYEKGIRQATVSGKGADLVLVDRPFFPRLPSGCWPRGWAMPWPSGTRESPATIR